VNFTYSEVEYLTRDDAQTMARLRDLLKTDRTEYVNKTGLDITRRIDGGPNPRPHNVLIVCVESLSAEFLGVFGNPKNLTPNLDKLADESILFTRLYACGTRTIRGLEAINLSLPPTPGRAVAKRRGSHKLFSAEHLMRKMGYRTMFFYGGHANFDNMDNFLCRGGFELIDDRKFRPEDIHFRSPWGICDGDVYHRAIAEFDATHQAGRKFYSMIMTVSNHIPFTYPKVIDIPSPSMFGAVKYTDYAIGQLLNEARTRPWFKDTIFVIVADHCQRHRAKSDSSPTKYHIPAFIYSPNPEIAKPQRINSLCSQIDLVPTVLGLMRASYTSKFFGQDVLVRAPERAFVGTPLDLGFLVGDRKIVLSPAHKAATYVVAAEEETQVPNKEDELDMAIAYYQGMGYMMRNRLQLQDAK
jgi:phosphoglycerol transferase MdoB-like AlkP superfamily enzyme